MVSYSDVLNSNSSLRSTGASPTAVFVGGTAGIGRAALLALAKHTSNPEIYIVGRSQSSLDPVITDLKSVNPNGDYITVVGSDLTLLSDVDKASEKIKSLVGEEGHLDILIMSVGYLTFASRTESAEGLDKVTSVRYYARMRFLLNLLPLLNAAPSARVVSVFAAGYEGPLWPEDFALKEKEHYSVANAATAAASMTTLFFEEMGKQNPKMVLIHLHPGHVPYTSLVKRTENFHWLAKIVLMWIIAQLVMFFNGYSVGEAGERVLFAATNGRFRAVGRGSGGKGLEGIEVGSGGMRGSGVYRVMGNSSAKEAPKLVRDMREEGVGRKLVDHTLGEFDRIANL